DHAERHGAPDGGVGAGAWWTAPGREGLTVGARRRWGRWAARLAGGGVLALALAWAILALPQRPSATRAWDGDHARLARAVFEGDSVVTIRDLRDFAYTSSTTYAPAYRTVRLALDSIESAWFILTPFSSTWRGPAHAFVSFGFRGGQYVSISVEARREQGETYGLVPGVLRRFELAYIVGTERDLIGRRARFDGDDVFLYPVASPTARVRQMFVEMLRRANAVQDVPEFYNTLTSNCTSNLVDHVNRMIPGRIPSSLQAILPGYADELALSLGLIDATGTLEELRARFRINDRARAALPGDDFSVAIRAGMRDRPTIAPDGHGDGT
ncbi:MAG TPA: DUF4105 domain-containing protein, partial [Gemmatimonadaceae bacterium]|nr:DUF4105 domain-containing protein [Gemmatimonadaceae bacterium]